MSQDTKVKKVCSQQRLPSTSESHQSPRGRPLSPVPDRWAPTWETRPGSRAGARRPANSEQDQQITD